MSGIPSPTVALLAARAALLAVPGQRRILGISGAPGSGKSTLADQLAAALGERSSVVGMDGFHLANCQLEADQRPRKGASDTFDADGYLALLRRLRENAEPVIYAPRFSRELDEPVAGAVAVPQRVQLVITEGNYLLLDSAPWVGVRELLDEAWQLVDESPQLRRDRLVERYLGFGWSRARAEEKAAGVDEQNSALVDAVAGRADLLVELSGNSRHESES
ncbi:panthothenate kinase [Jatrophihabitans sp. GAS493]|uniref:nucleoside/nucleotide kinase family protein n=1 Tax=Jatrophihabitans sp. GAS493 TaxID=1907575 RepID=UPI000BB815BD|nr:nucleoside/nucleotide kinase family protein [Jatrophihabitans sp. GAS493]SOD71367.1 panthothenate kinase [Jatrophihabitans sp. GAS493]